MRQADYFPTEATSRSNRSALAPTDRSARLDSNNFDLTRLRCPSPPHPLDDVNLPFLTLLDVDAALARQRAFGLLDEQTRAALAQQLTLRRFRADEVIVETGQLHAKLGLILAGTAALRNVGDDVTVTLHAGELFGYGLAQPDEPALWMAAAASDCQVAFLQPNDVAALCRTHPQLRYFLPASASTTEPPSVFRQRSDADSHLNLTTMPVRALIKREPITLPPTTSIRAAAQLMRDRRVSSILLVEQEHLFGLITDRDLRDRVVAQGLDIDQSIIEIATLAPLTIDGHSPAFDALLLMARHNIHHVPVMQGQQVVGMITATDLTEQHSTSPVYLTGDIYKQDSVDGLVLVAAKTKQLQRNLAAADATAYSTGHIVTAITDALTTRLLQLAEAELGPTPVDYAWVAAGSQGRGEQTAKSDQDNCLILDDGYDPARHGAYFEALSRYVCDGLDACGYAYCPGEMMAATDAWRQPRHRWWSYFRRWVEQPDPTALMLTTVFFDMRLVYGRAALLDELRRDVLRLTQGNRIFLAHMVNLALQHQPALGLFGNLVPIRTKEHAGTIDLKHSGVVPIIDLARVYALAAGLQAVNTNDRLAQAAQSREISERDARDLRDALEFIGALRLKHQARRLARGQEVDNFVVLDELSNFERSQLKDAFSVVQTLQKVLAQRFR